jgi:hypothetical protein
MLSRFAIAISFSRALLLALLSGISGSGPSRSKPEASVPSWTESEAMPLSGCTRLSSRAFFARASASVSPTTTKAPGRIFRWSGSRPIFAIRPFTSA